MNTALISAGSNINPAESIDKAKELLLSRFRTISFSRNRVTKPVGFTDQPDFVNAVFCLNTEIDKAELDLELKNIETLLGRVRTANKNGPRTIDLDVVVWTGAIVDEDVYTRDFLREMIIEMLPEMKNKIRKEK